jgi:hypothetical protein
MSMQAALLLLRNGGSPDRAVPAAHGLKSTSLGPRVAPGRILADFESPKNAKTRLISGLSSYSGGRIRTCDLRVMSPNFRSAGLRGARFQAEFARFDYVEIGWNLWGMLPHSLPQEIATANIRSSRWPKIPGKSPIPSLATSTPSWTRPRSRFTRATPMQSCQSSPAAEPAVRRRCGPCCCVTLAPMEVTPPSM